MSDNTSILIFKAITSFISDLDSEFGKKHKSIALYNRLLEKTGIVHIGPVHKHIECFKKFFDLNKNAMNDQNPVLFENSKIVYSEKVYVDIATVLRQTSEDNKKIICHINTGEIETKETGMRSKFKYIDTLYEVSELIFTKIFEEGYKTTETLTDRMTDIVSYRGAPLLKSIDIFFIKLRRV